VTTIPLTLYERSGYARTNAPVIVSIPLSESDAVFSASLVAIYQNGVQIDTQAQALSRWWGDVSDTTKYISCVQVVFTCASLAANAIDSTTYTLRTGTSNAASGITVTDNSTSWDINTGAATFRLRQTSGGAHNLLDVVTSASGKTFLSAGNASGLYLHGVERAANYRLIDSSSNDLTGSIGSPLNSTELKVIYNGTTYPVPFGPTATAHNTVAKVLALITAQGSTSTWMCRYKDDTLKSLRLLCRNPSDTISIDATGTAATVLGFSGTGDYTHVAQDADYSSNAYTGSTYTTSIEWQGSELVVAKATGKFGTSGSEFMGNQDDSCLAKDGTDRHCSDSDMEYEARYYFYKNSAYVGIDVLWQGGNADASGRWSSDAAVKHGGIAVVPNFSGSGTKLATYDPGDSAGDYAATLTYTSGSPYAYQDFAPSGSSNGFTVGSSWTGYLGGAGHTLDEGWMVVQQSADDRHIISMTYRTPKETVPQGFKYDGTQLLVQPWVEERGELTSGFTTRPYHIFPGNRHYRWRGGLLFADGGYAVATVRNQWATHCRYPILVHCQDQYETSTLFGDVGVAPNVVRVSSQDYRCTVSHVATAATQPGVGASWATVWTATATSYGVSWVLGGRYSSFQMPDPDGDGLLEEARNKWIKWKYAMVDSSVTGDTGSLPVSYGNRNSSQATCYGWSRFGMVPYQTGCNSNHYDHVMRLTRAWFVTGDPRFYDWADAMADHMAWVCTNHWDGSGGFSPANRYCTYGETGNVDAAIHGHQIGDVRSVQNCQFRAYWYALTGYTPLKDLSTRFVTNYAGRLDGVQYLTMTLQTPARIQTIRDWSWSMDNLLHHYKIFGDTTSLTYARNVMIHAMVYTHDLCGAGMAIQNEEGGTDTGGLGFVPNCVNGATADATPRNRGTLTYLVYPLDPITNFIEWGTKAREVGGQTAIVSAADIAHGYRWLRQAFKYILTGPDELSPNKSLQLSDWTSMVRPIFRGGYKGGVDGASIVSGQSTLLLGMFYYPCGAGVYTAYTQFLTTDTGIAPCLSTTIDGVTATISGTTVTLSSIPTGMPHLALSWFYVDADGPAMAKKISSHISGTGTFTLESTYLGTTGAGKSFTITLGGWGPERGRVSASSAGGTAQLEHANNFLDAGVRLYRYMVDNALTAEAAALKPLLRRSFEQTILYGMFGGGTNSSGDWSQTSATTGRGLIYAGYTAGSTRERPQGWFNRNAMNRYLAAERDGVFDAVATPVDTGSRDYALVRIG
jgi:hypothetical protein